MSPLEISDKFISVIQANKGIIYKVTNSFCTNEEDRKDLEQEIIVQLWKSFNNYKEQYKYSTWIYQIALNVSISYYRKEKRNKAFTNPLSENIIIFSDESEKNDTQEKTDILYRFILELKELNKALILLYVEEKSYKEIAEIIGISETNVATKIGRIKTILKQKFNQIKQN